VADGVSDALGDAGLDVLINNAGILTPGPIECCRSTQSAESSMSMCSRALSVINAHLPALRKARGRVVQVSTWTASVPLPFNGPSEHRKLPRRCSWLSTGRTEKLWRRLRRSRCRNMKTGGPRRRLPLSRAFPTR